MTTFTIRKELELLWLHKIAWRSRSHAIGQCQGLAQVLKTKGEKEMFLQRNGNGKLNFRTMTINKQINQKYFSNKMETGNCTSKQWKSIILSLTCPFGLPTTYMRRPFTFVCTRIRISDKSSFDVNHFVVAGSATVIQIQLSTFNFHNLHSLVNISFLKEKKG